MVTGLNLKAHVLQAQADLPAGALAVVQGAQVEIAGLVGGLGGGVAVIVRLEQEKLQLRPHVEGIAHALRPLDHLLQNAPGIAHEGRAVRIVDVADQTGHLAVLGPPGQDGEGIQVRPQVLVGLLNADKALNGAAVQHDLVVYGPLHLGRRDGDVFHLSENVGELHADELNIFFLHQADNILFAVFAHGVQSPFSG